jgi:flotillin
MAKATIARERIEAERREFEAPAKAQKAKSSSTPSCYRPSDASRPKATPPAIFAKLDAEARGNYEILAKRPTVCDRSSTHAAARAAFELLMLEHLDKLTEGVGEGDLKSNSTRSSFGKTAKGWFEYRELTTWPGTLP